MADKEVDSDGPSSYLDVIVLFSILSADVNATTELKYMFGLPYWEWDDLNLVQMHLSTDEPATIIIDGPGNVANKHLTLQPGSTNISLTEWSSSYQPSYYEIFNGTFILTSDRDINIYIFIVANQYSEGFLVPPVTDKSTEFLVTAYNKRNNWNYIGILADESTLVSVTNLNTSEYVWVGSQSYTGTINTTLPVHSTMTVQYSYPTSAVRIRSDKPVAIQTYIQCPYVNPNYYSCSMIMEQFPPLAFWKHNFVLGSFGSWTSYVLQIISSVNNNQVNIGTQTILLHEAQIYEKRRNSDDAIVVEAAHPVLVLQYVYYNNATYYYDREAMIIVPAVEQYLSSYTFTVPPYFDGDNQLVISIDSSHVSGLRLDGKQLSGGTERRVYMRENTNKEYSVVRFQISPGVHRLTHIQNVPFGAISFGSASSAYNAAYGLPLGLAYGPSCEPACQNDGKCVSDNVCHCKPGFYGQLCEKGSAVDGHLKPELHTLIPGYNLTDHMSWYEQPDFTVNNKVCYVKINVQNGSPDVIVSASSSTDRGSIYGNFTAGPIDSSATYLGASRSACLEVRCPFATIYGTIQNTVVSVTIDNNNQTCHVSNHMNGITNMTVSRDSTQSDKLEFTLEAGDNYGSHYGVYTGIGTLGKAKYLAEHKCYSGREYDFDSFNTDLGVLATYTC